MDKDYQKLFTHLKSAEPPAGLFDKIIYQIHRQQRTSAIKRVIIIFSLGIIVPMVALVPSFAILHNRLVETGFIQYFSLIFSDFGIMMTYWQNFFLTLLESLPVVSLVAFLIIVLVFLESLKLLARNLKVAFTLINN